MTVRNFGEMMSMMASRQRFLCVGLDPDVAKIPVSIGGSIPDKMLSFNRSIIDATKDIVCAFKPNSAFYEAEGADGWRVLKKTIEYINEVAPDVPVIFDAKRADIGNTNEGYATAAFDYLKADAITVHPYMGGEALAPFFARKDKGIFVLCRTSNPHSNELQDLIVDGMPLYMCIARMATESWNSNDNCALVVGATHPKELALIRALVGNMTILIPGVGVQGGDVVSAVQAAQTNSGEGFIINAGRSIIYASAGDDFAQAARAEAIVINSAIKKALVE